MRRVFINTIGCQMNVYDSDQIERVLAPGGYTRTAQLDEADLVVVNTCAIRAKAEQKAFSFVGRLTKLKQRRPDLMVAVGGCVAQQEGKKILARAPQVDLVFGPKAIPRLGRKKSDHIRLKGEVPTPINLPSGCVFHGRCVHADRRCVEEVPEAKAGFRMLFSAKPFPGHMMKVVWRRAERGGNWY